MRILVYGYKRENSWNVKKLDWKKKAVSVSKHGQKIRLSSQIGKSIYY